jgi:hypothetical protein
LDCRWHMRRTQASTTEIIADHHHYIHHIPRSLHAYVHATIAMAAVHI